MMTTLKPVVRSVHAVLPWGTLLAASEAGPRLHPLLAVGRHVVARLELLQRTQTCLGADECG